MTHIIKKLNLSPLILMVGVLIALSGLWACGGKQMATEGTLQSDYDVVKECMGVVGDTPPVTVVPVPEALQPSPGKVQCGDLEARGCYRSSEAKIYMPVNAKRNTLKHEYVHHILFVTTGDSDNLHASPYFQQCGGIIIIEDVD